MTLTLHKNQVHCSGVMKLTVHSCPLLPAKGGCNTCERIVVLLFSLLYNNMATIVKGIGVRGGGLPRHRLEKFHGKLFSG